MSTYKKEREINHKGAEGARRRLKTKKSGTFRLIGLKVRIYGEKQGRRI
jgi:hypothetical protein